MKTRFALTMVNPDGLRVLARPNQAHLHFDTPDLAQQHLADTLRVNSDSILRSFCGDPSKLRVDPIECYDNGDAIRSIIGDDDLPSSSPKSTRPSA
jgi:hypothetical protein